jgi:PAS domain S-box-containing protein
MLKLNQYFEKIKKITVANTDGYDVVDFRIGTLIGTTILFIIPILNLFYNILPDHILARNLLIIIQLSSIIASYHIQFFKVWANEVGNAFSLIYSIMVSTIAYLNYFNMKDSAFALIVTFSLMGMFKNKRMMLLYSILSIIYIQSLIIFSPITFENKYFLVTTSLVLFGIGFYIFSLKLDAVKDLQNREFLIAQKEAWFRSIFENVPTGIILYDTNYQPFKSNKFIQDFLGYSEKELFDLGIHNLVEKEDLIPESEIQGYVKKSRIYEQRIKNKAGQQLWVRVKLAPMEIDNKQYLIAMLNDITAEKANDMQLREFTQQLKVHNEALEEFSYVISHDLQEPLRMITGFTQIIKKKYLPKINEPQADIDFNFVIDGAKRMSALIRDMLDYSRWSTRALPNEKVDVNEVLKETLQNLAVTISEKNAEILSTHMPNIHTNRLMLGQIFQNLIANAIKYGHPNRVPIINISLKIRAKDYIFIIKDNGIGFESQYNSRIFGIFQRLNSSRDEGNGMGLAICKRVIEKQGGTIWAESVLDEGSKFYFTLPHCDLNIQNEDLQNTIQKSLTEHAFV